MKSYRLFLTLLTLTLVACLSGVQGQFQEQYLTTSSGLSGVSQSAGKDPQQYSQFYTTGSGPSPKNPIGAPQNFELTGNMPTKLYFGELMQLVPFSQYQSNPFLTGTNSLWIKGKTAWTQYAAVPQGAILSILTISPTEGRGLLTYEDPHGQTYSHNYQFYPNSLFTFYANSIGRHTFSFTINGQESNNVVIDVEATYTQPRDYIVPATRHQWYNYPWYYYSGYYWVSPLDNLGRKQDGDEKDKNKPGRDHDGNRPHENNTNWNDTDRDHGGHHPGSIPIGNQPAGSTGEIAPSSNIGGDYPAGSYSGSGRADTPGGKQLLGSLEESAPAWNTEGDQPASSNEGSAPTSTPGEDHPSDSTSDIAPASNTDGDRPAGGNGERGPASTPVGNHPSDSTGRNSTSLDDRHK